MCSKTLYLRTSLRGGPSATFRCLGEAFPFQWHETVWGYGQLPDGVQVMTSTQTRSMSNGGYKGSPEVSVEVVPVSLQCVAPDALNCDHKVIVYLNWALFGASDKKERHFRMTE